MRLLQKLAVAMGVVACGLLALSAPSGAATGAEFPGAPVNGTSAQAGPNQSPASSFRETACGFAPGAAVVITTNGTSASSATAGAKGCATSNVAVSDSHVTINGGMPIAVPFGSTEIAATGTSAGGGNQSDTYRFDFVPPSNATATPAGLVLTGADIMAIGIGVLALLAFGFLLVIFSRRRTLTV